MNQSTTFILIMTGTMLLFYVTGVLSGAETVNSSLITMLTHPQSLNTSQASALLTKSITAIGVAIVIGFLFRNTDYAVRAPVAVYLMSLMYDYLIVFQKLNGTIGYVFGLLVLSPLAFIWLFVVIDYLAGRD